MIDHHERPLRPLSALSLAAMAAAFIGLAGCDDAEDGTDGVDGAAGHTVPGLTRLATLPLGAEATGLFIQDGDLFSNVQHPSTDNDTKMTDAAGKQVTFGKATVGVLTGFDATNPPENIAGIDAPSTRAEKEVYRSALGEYQVLMQQGDKLADGNTAGDIVGENGKVVLNSSDPDFNGVIPDGNSGYYVYTNWEDQPGGMSRVQISRKGLQWTIDAKEGMLDFTEEGGTWFNCFGTVSPWGTPLTSEELYLDDTAQWYTPNEGGWTWTGVQTLAEYLGYDSDPDQATAWPNPYRLGYIVELTNPDGTSAPTTDTLSNVEKNKLFALGRGTHENAVVMPDNKTVYMSEDGTDRIMTKFVADAAGDLSQGTLYAAQVTQDSGTNDPAITGFDIKWVKLADSTQEADLETDIAKFDGVTFEEKIYFKEKHIQGYAEEYAGTDLDKDGTKETFDGLDLNGDGDASDSGDIASDSNVIAFVETRKVAAALGATNEFRKMEGINVNLKRAEDAVGGGSNGTGASDAYVYVAMSNTNEGMADGEGDIQLNGRAGDCGAVYRMELKGGYDVDRLEPVLEGGPYNGDRIVNTCNVNNISEPDNLLVLDDGRVIIGEDTGGHENNMIWIYDEPQQN